MQNTKNIRVFSHFCFSRKAKGSEMVNKTTISMLNSHPVSLKKWFSSSHLFICKHPFENPNNPPFIFWNGWQGAFKFPTSYSTWSCKEPPTLILKGFRAIKQPLWKEWYHTWSKYSKHDTINKNISSIRKSQNSRIPSEWLIFYNINTLDCLRKERMRQVLKKPIHIDQSLKHLQSFLEF